MKLSEIYGAEAVSIGGKKRGYVAGALVTDGNAYALVCFDESERKFFIDFNDFTLTDGKILFGEAAKDIKGGVPLRLGKAAYGEDGKFSGFLQDIVCDGERIKYARIGGRHYAAERLRIGEAVIIKDKKDYAENAAKDLFISAVINRTAP